jgi:hypothetical protein
MNDPIGPWTRSSPSDFNASSTRFADALFNTEPELKHNCQAAEPNRAPSCVEDSLIARDYEAVFESSGQIATAI